MWTPMWVNAKNAPTETENHRNQNLKIDLRVGWMRSEFLLRQLEGRE